MSSKFNNIAIICKKLDIINLSVDKLINYLLSLKVNIFYLDFEKDILKTAAQLTAEHIPHDISNYPSHQHLFTLLNHFDFSVLDMIVVLGGDGTILSVARNVVDHQIPIIGINQGKLGFMTDIVADNMLESLGEILIEHQYQLEWRTLLHAKILRDGNYCYGAIALNDVVISRGATGNMIEFDIIINGQFVLSQKSDGVIFATPTGSTAYSLAAGGPIMQPTTNVFSIVPICPQSLSNRPLVVNDDVQIEFILTVTNATKIHFDGQICFDLQLNDKIILSKHHKQSFLIHPNNYNYYRTLRKKLAWSKRVS